MQNNKRSLIIGLATAIVLLSTVVGYLFLGQASKEINSAYEQVNSSLEYSKQHMQHAEPLTTAELEILEKSQPEVYRKFRIYTASYTALDSLIGTMKKEMSEMLVSASFDSDKDLINSGKATLLKKMLPTYFDAATGVCGQLKSDKVLSDAFHPNESWERESFSDVPLPAALTVLNALALNVETCDQQVNKFITEATRGKH